MTATIRATKQATSNNGKTRDFFDDDDPFEEREKIRQCVAGELPRIAKLEGDGRWRWLQIRCNRWICPKCGPFMAEQFANRVKAEMTARGSKRLTRLEVLGDLSTVEGKKLRTKINKVCKTAKVLHKIFPYENSFVLLVVGRIDLSLSSLLGDSTISHQRLKPNDVDWFQDCQTTGNKSGSLGKKVPKPKGDGTTVVTPKITECDNISREDRIEATVATYKRTIHLCDTLPTGSLTDTEKKEVEAAYIFAYDVLTEELEARGGRVTMSGSSRVFYSSWFSSKNLGRDDVRKTMPEFPELSVKAKVPL